MDFHIPGFCDSMYEIVIYVDNLALKVAVFPPKAKALAYSQCESRVEQELGKSGSNAAKDMTKQARQGADQGGGLDVR